MQAIKFISKVAHKVIDPIYIRRAKQNNLVEDLGAGRANRQGRALVSYVSNFVQHITETAGREIWDAEDNEAAFAPLCVGQFGGHSNHWESAEIVRQLIGKGFIVDCIYGRNGYLIDDASKYDLILDEWTNIETWGAQSPNAIKWRYTVVSHWLHWNSAEMQRSRWLFQRTGHAITPSRQLPPLEGNAEASLISYVGNDFIRGTYNQYQPKMHKLQVSTSIACDQLRPKDWAIAKKRFLFFGSTGWVHRGLDLVLEAFLQMDLELFICGGDQGFFDVYGEKIEGRSNIHYLGFVLPESARFRELVDTTCAVIYPSAAEGCSTSVLQCMHFGLIPLVTLAAGQDIHHITPPLDDTDDHTMIEDIVTRCQTLVNSSSEQLEELRQAIWKYASENHSRDAYRHSLRRIVDTLN